jgi:hypothetical protein
MNPKISTHKNYTFLKKTPHFCFLRKTTTHLKDRYLNILLKHLILLYPEINEKSAVKSMILLFIDRWRRIS